MSPGGGSWFSCPPEGSCCSLKNSTYSGVFLWVLTPTLPPVLYSSKHKNLSQLLRREACRPGARWHPPAQHPAPPGPIQETKGRRRRLTFRGSPLFGLQRREGAHDGPHGSEDLCVTWDPGPCPSPPLERNQCGLSTPNWRKTESKGTRRAVRQPRGSPRASVGLGLWRLLASFFSPAHAPPRRRASGSRKPLTVAPTRPGRSPRPEPRTMSPKPAWCWTRGPARLPGRGCRASAACGAGTAERPPLLPHARLPSRRSGWVSRGRVPIMNEQRRGLARGRRAPACARSLVRCSFARSLARWLRRESERRRGQPAGNCAGRAGAERVGRAAPGAPAPASLVRSTPDDAFLGGSGPGLGTLEDG